MKYKTGDIIKILYGGCTQQIGNLAKVLQITSQSILEVEFLIPIPYSGHNGSGLGKRGFCWYLAEKDIELYKSIGDYLQSEEYNKINNTKILTKFKLIEARHLKTKNTKKSTQKTKQNFAEVTGILFGDAFIEHYATTREREERQSFDVVLIEP